MPLILLKQYWKIYWASAKLQIRHAVFFALMKGLHYASLSNVKSLRHCIKWKFSLHTWHWISYRGEGNERIYVFCRQNVCTSPWITHFWLRVMEVIVVSTQTPDHDDYLRTPIINCHQRNTKNGQLRRLNIRFTIQNGTISNKRTHFKRLLF